VTLEELEDTLPNGLHDSEVQSILIDYVQRRATMQLSVFVGELDAPVELREAYKEASLVISGLLFAVLEPPDSSYRFAEPASLRVDACDMSKDLDPSLLAVLPEGSFVRSLFVKDWNAFVHFAGSDAGIFWKEQGAITYRKKRDHILPGEIMDL
jgi:hypothetical protein